MLGSLTDEDGGAVALGLGISGLFGAGGGLGVVGIGGGTCFKPTGGVTVDVTVVVFVVRGEGATVAFSGGGTVTLDTDCFSGGGPFILMLLLLV